MPDEDKKVAKQKAEFMEMGEYGLEHSAGRVQEEFLTDLRGSKAVEVYKEMRDNDPIVGAALLAIQNLVKQADWHVKPASEDPRDVEIAEFIDSTRHDMEESWEEFITEAMSMTVFGWSLHEMVFKRRNGNILDPERGSKFDDGRIGIKGLPIRSQDSLWRWEFDDSGRVESFVQSPPADFERIEIPRSKFLLFRASRHKNNPEGKSILRSAYRPWSFKKRIEEIEGIGLERDLAGIPIVKVPPRILKAEADTEEKATLDRIKKMVQNVRNDEQAGIIIPAVYDERGNEMFTFDLMSTRGRRNFDTTDIIERYNRVIAMSMLADFIVIGHESVGSFALASSKTKLFSTAIGSYMDIIANEFNNRVVPKLLRLNGMTDVEQLPQLVHSDVETVDLESLAKYIKALSGVGIDLTDDAIMQYLGDQASIPTEEISAAQEEDEDSPTIEAQDSDEDEDMEGDEDAS